MGAQRVDFRYRSYLCSNAVVRLLDCRRKSVEKYDRRGYQRTHKYEHRDITFPVKGNASSRGKPALNVASMQKKFEGITGDPWVLGVLLTSWVVWEWWASSYFVGCLGVMGVEHSAHGICKHTILEATDILHSS